MAVITEWDNQVDQAVTHLQDALALAQETGLPGKELPILGALGVLNANQGKQAEARQARRAAAEIILRLAATIEVDGLQAGYLAAGPIRSILDAI